MQTSRQIFSETLKRLCRRMTMAALLLMLPKGALPVSAEFVTVETQSPSSRVAGQEIDVGNWKMQAEAGDADAMTALGLALRDGIGADHDAHQAEYWLSKAANHGDRRASLELAEFYFHQNDARAISLYRRLAHQGMVEAQNNLAAIYLDGWKGHSDLKAARELLQRAADAGLAAAQFNLAKLYETGRLVPQDFSQAYEWFSKAAAQRYSPAENELGNLCLQGLGTARDYVQARHWFELAAASSFAPAANNLGAIYARGLGVKEDPSLAFEWYKKAAVAGSATAQNNLGVAYFTGRGVERNVDQALEWLVNSAAQGNTDAQYNFRAVCHTVSEPPRQCAERLISGAPDFQRPGARVLWKSDYVE